MTKAELSRIEQAISHITDLLAEAPLLDPVRQALDDQLSAYIGALDADLRALDVGSKPSLAWSNPAHPKSRKRKARLTLVG